MAVTFTEQFEQALSGQEGVRSDKVANTSLANLVSNTTGRKDNKIVLEVLEKSRTVRRNHKTNKYRFKYKRKVW